MAKSSSSRVSRDKKSSARSSRTTEVEVVEESSSLGLEGGVGIVCAILLIVAFVLIDHELGSLGAGLFFKK